MNNLLYFFYFATCITLTRDITKKSMHFQNENINDLSLTAYIILILIPYPRPIVWTKMIFFFFLRNKSRSSKDQRKSINCWTEAKNLITYNFSALISNLTFKGFFVAFSLRIYLESNKYWFVSHRMRHMLRSIKSQSIRMKWDPDVIFKVRYWDSEKRFLTISHCGKVDNQIPEFSS